MFLTTALPPQGARVTIRPMRTVGRYVCDIQVANGFVTFMDVTEKGLAELAAEWTNAAAQALREGEQKWRPEPEPLDVRPDVNMTSTEFAREQADYVAGR